MDNSLTGRILSLILAVLMVCGQMSGISVYAGENVRSTPWQSKEDFADMEYDNGENIDLSDSKDTLAAAANSSRYFNFDGAETITLLNSAQVTVTGNNADGKYRLAVADEAVVTLTLNNTTVKEYSNFSAIALGDNSRVTLFLRGSNTLSGGTNFPGVLVTESSILTICAVEAGGTLVSTGGSCGAGIGGSSGADSGVIIVESGTVNAQGGLFAAGIGGGYTASGGKTIVQGGMVTAKGGTGGAGIGGGSEGSSEYIDISGGTVYATGGIGAAGIGGGYTCGGGNVNISGSYVKAEGGDSSKGGDNGADLGSGGEFIGEKTGSFSINSDGILELVKYGVVHGDIAIEECVIRGGGAGELAGTYSWLRLNGGTALMVGGAWPGNWESDSSGQIVKSGTVVVLRAEVRPEYTFVGWTVDTNNVSVRDGMITMPESDVAITGKYSLSYTMVPEIALHTTEVYVEVGGETTLDVNASVSDGGTLSYQWYETYPDSLQSDRAVSGAVKSSYSPDASTVGEKWYYVVVTNTNSKAILLPTVSVTSDVIKVTVSEKTYSVTVAAGTGGRILTNASGQYPQGKKIEIQADTYDGYIFVGWTSSFGDIFEDSGKASTVCTMPGGNVTIMAVFEEQINAQTPVIDEAPASTGVVRGDKVTLSVTAAVTDGGTLSYQWYISDNNSIGGGTPISGATDSTYSPNTDAIGHTYYYVVVTNYCETATGEKAVSIATAKVTVVISEESYTLTVLAEAGGKIVSDTYGYYPEGTEVDLNAEAFEGYDFTYWYCDGGQIADMWSASSTFKMPPRDTMITANFTSKTYSITVISEAGGRLLSDPSTKCQAGTKISLSAEAEEGYEFIGWSSNGGGAFDDSRGVSTVFTMPAENIIITARFEEVSRVSTYRLTVVTGVSGSIVTGSYVEGEKVNIEAEEANGYKFLGWSSNTGGIFDDSESPVTTFTMPGTDTVVTAGFDIVTDSEMHSPYIEGFTDGTFRPETAITRGQVAQIFYNLSDTEDESYTNSFSDVSTEDWYYKAVMTLAEMGVIQGYENGTFRPDSYVTRAEFTAMVVRFDGLIPRGMPIFTDVEDGHWAVGYIAVAQSAGLINGYDDGSFSPEKSMKRAEAVTLINRMLGRTPAEGTFEGYSMIFSDVKNDHWARDEIIEAAVEHSAEQ